MGGCACKSTPWRKSFCFWVLGGSLILIMGSFVSDASPAEAKAFVSEEDCKHAHTHAHTRMRTHMVFLCSAHKLHTHTHTGLSLVSGGVGRSGREADASQTSNGGDKLRIQSKCRTECGRTQRLRCLHRAAKVEVHRVPHPYCCRAAHTPTTTEKRDGTMVAEPWIPPAALPFLHDPRVLETSTAFRQPI